MSDILIVDDDLGEYKAGLQQALRGNTLRFAFSGEEGLELLAKYPTIEVVLLDVKMPACFAQDEEREGIEVLKRIKTAYADIPVIMLTVLTHVDLVVEAIQLGAYHYITKPIDRDRLRDAVGRATENRHLRTQVINLTKTRDAILRVQTGGAKKHGVFCGIVGSHPLMQQLYAQIERAAPYEGMNIVILGETGSGKDLVARAIHACSPRASKPFETVNCAAIAESVLDAELFGHEKGSFTGAEVTREGLFRRASGGTLFLDEIGDMSMALQSKVLRAVENKEITPVGGKTERVDVRIVCATNKDLTQAKDDGDFREDLYYRICEIPLVLPPLQDRKEDIPALVKCFLKEWNMAYKSHVTITPDAVKALGEFNWPGNVRELRSRVHYLAVFAANEIINAEQVQGNAQDDSPSYEYLAAAPQIGAESLLESETAGCEDPEFSPCDGEYPVVSDLAQYRRVHGEVQLRGLLVRALRKGGGAREAMSLLGMPADRYDAFRKWLQRLGIQVRDICANDSPSS